MNTRSIGCHSYTTDFRWVFKELLRFRDAPATLRGHSDYAILDIDLSGLSAGGHRIMIGTPQSIADDFEEWFSTGAADGFHIRFSYASHGMEDFVDLAVPELQRRGLFRTRYEGTTLRENLGLRRIQNRAFPKPH